MILHHPFGKTPEELLCGVDLPPDVNGQPGKYISWAVAYQIECLDKGHQHPDDTLPTAAETLADPEDSDSESVQGDDPDVYNYQAEWMQEAGRAPHESVESNLGNLGKRDMDLEYNWIENSPDQDIVKAAAVWVEDLVKESPNDEIQGLPDHDYKKLKGKQREVFLQVMAYFKRINSDLPGPKPSPPRINIDGTAGTGKSFLIWCITAALRDLFGVDEHDISAKDPTEEFKWAAVTVVFGRHSQLLQMRFWVVFQHLFLETFSNSLPLVTHHCTPTSHLQADELD
ncbi:hypothetical protein B0H15DRAFT_796242 [Mycena belliarum]|uniref:ATP-dependent DNA helicase n=1 Tax=Mycena belliarum TaxID=1033014 RepID=A0AAD6UIM1_9AGAR|nr:hypothetical protein B0H15DRAFT_796242 [Mycena belliae]